MTSFILQLDDVSKQVHYAIMARYPHAFITEQPGFQSVSYGLKPGMQHVACYIIMYKTYANLGFPRGVDLVSSFPFLKGSGKTHRHITITRETTKQAWFIDIISLAFSR